MFLIIPVKKSICQYINEVFLLQTLPLLQLCNAKSSVCFNIENVFQQLFQCIIFHTHIQTLTAVTTEPITNKIPLAMPRA